MNIIDDFWNVIIQEQSLIEILLIIVGIILFLIFAIKGINNGKNKKDILLKINESVFQINATVNSLEKNSPEVIYIDNRSGDKTNDDAEASNNEDFTPITKNEETKTEKPKEVVERNRRKYFDRNCGIDKNGKIYTLEELYNQIKE